MRYKFRLYTFKTHVLTKKVTHVLTKNVTNNEHIFYKY